MIRPHAERHPGAAARVLTCGIRKLFRSCQKGLLLRRVLLLGCMAGALAGALPYFLTSSAQGRTIVQIELADIIHPISADYVAAGLARAEEIGAAAVIIRLDTPGGLVDSMRAVVEEILTADVPVIVWVGPSGVRAASAGFFILLSGDREDSGGR